ncbi:MAG: hypothetical protein ACTSYI_16660 [Promethearchaeota archaeon]
MSLIRRQMQTSKTGLLITIPLYLIVIVVLIFALIIPAIPAIKDGTVESEVFIGGLAIILVGVRLIQSSISLKNMIQKERETAQKDSNPNHEDDLRKQIKLENGY